jgi:hypothetical protein
MLIRHAAKAFQHYVFSPLFNASDNPRSAFSTDCPLDVMAEVTYSSYETWFASATFQDLPAEHAAL